MKAVLQPLRAILTALALVLGAPAHAEEPARNELLVLAAASLTDVLGEISSVWGARTGIKVKLSLAASSVLARQIEAGGNADVFISADQEWMDYLQARGLLDNSSRRNLAVNRLALIAPADSKLVLEIAPGFKLGDALGKGRLATGDPDTVPVGRYARSALRSLAVWDDVADRLVRADNVRSAVMFVARGEVPLGIVYTTDALADSRIRIVDIFPAASHAAITYPGASTKGANVEARAYLQFLAGPQAGVIWQKFGFLEPGKAR